jgi:hypothetical protein
MKMVGNIILVIIAMRLEAAVCISQMTERVTIERYPAVD